MSNKSCETQATQDPQEISIDRLIHAPPEVIWNIMTERLTEWWCPRPWMTEITHIDWRAGGRFETIMRGPEGQEVVNRGILLEFTPHQRMVFTDAVNADWMPQGPFMIGIMELQVEGAATRYIGRARHWTEETRKQHEEMGFTPGWSAVADQLAELAEAA